MFQPPSGVWRLECDGRNAAQLARPFRHTLCMNTRSRSNQRAIDQQLATPVPSVFAVRQKIFLCSPNPPRISSSAAEWIPDIIRRARNTIIWSDGISMLQWLSRLARALAGEMAISELTKNVSASTVQLSPTSPQLSALHRN